MAKATEDEQHKGQSAEPVKRVNIPLTLLPGQRNAPLANFTGAKEAQAKKARIKQHIKRSKRPKSAGGRRKPKGKLSSCCRCSLDPPFFLPYLAQNTHVLCPC